VEPGASRGTMIGWLRSGPCLTLSFARRVWYPRPTVNFEITRQEWARRYVSLPSVTMAPEESFRGCAFISSCAPEIPEDSDLRTVVNHFIQDVQSQVDCVGLGEGTPRRPQW
jgi:hypothetical protein